MKRFTPANKKGVRDADIGPRMPGEGMRPPAQAKRLAPELSGLQKSAPGRSRIRHRPIAVVRAARRLAGPFRVLLRFLRAYSKL